MSTDALDAQGTILQMGDGAGTEVFTTIPSVTSISPFEGTPARRDVTDLSATKYRQRKRGLQDPDTTTFTVQWKPADAIHASLWTAAHATPATEHNFRLTLTDSVTTTYSFRAEVDSVRLGGLDVDGTVTATIVLSHVGDVTVAA